MDESVLRERIDELERELMGKHEELAKLRRQLPLLPLRNYGFVDHEGRDVTLEQLFGDAEDLIVIHNMGVGCRYCTLWADGFNGALSQLESRAGFVVVSPDPPEVQRDIYRRRGWRFRMVSDRDKDFTRELGFLRDEEGRPEPWPGFSTLWRSESGDMHRVASADFGPGDIYCPAWHMFALLKDGVAGWEPEPNS